MNSKQKGSRGERECRDVWKKHGYEDAHRSQQYSGKGESSADIEGIDPRLHIECKVGYTYKTIYDFMEQAVRDAKEGQIPIVNCKMDRKEWLCVMRLDDFIEMWQGINDVCRNCKHSIHYMPHDSFDDKWKCDLFNCAVPEKFWCGMFERRNDGKISNT